MKEILGYIRTVKNYCKSPKGRFDVLDYAKAIAIFVVVTIFAIILLKFWEG